MTKEIGTREKILNAAVKAISKGGENNLRIVQICKETGTTAPSLYHFFGSRDGLIEAAHARRFIEAHHDLSARFADEVHMCRSKSDFIKLAHDFMSQMFADDRKGIRSMRISVLGSAQNRRNLAKRVSESQDSVNRLAGQAFRFAQVQRWIRDDFDCDMFVVWLNGLVNAQNLIELDGFHPSRSQWKAISVRSICAVLGIPEPRLQRSKR
jgi:AcrR family transcriptional regulator